MALPQIAGLPPSLDLDAGYVIRFTAIDATSGGEIAGVRVTNATIRALNAGGGGAGALESGPFMLVPGPGA